jgi:uncharacterized protein (DUF2267 family)
MTTGLDAFDSTLQQSNLWLKDIMERIGTNDRHLAYQLLRATLHTVRDRIGPENAVHFGAQLPTLIRGFYYDGWKMTHTPTRTRHLEDFLDDIEYEARRQFGSDTEEIIKTVFEVIGEHIAPGEMEKLAKVLPAELRELVNPKW